MEKEIKALRVKDLYEEMKSRVEKGQGDYVVFVTDDEEGNGFHALWFKGTEIAKCDKQERKAFEDYNCDISLVKDNPDKAIYLG